MRVNEENFTTGDVEDVEPSYVELVVGNHNNDEGAHPDIRKMINQTQAFYQNAKDYVEGVAEAAYNSASDAAESANFAADEAIIASEAKTEAVKAAAEAKEAEDAVKVHYPQIIDGNWFVWDAAVGEFVDSGTAAQGEKGEKGEQGEQGEKGETGANGQDGYTPRKGIDYFDGEDGYTPQRGVDYWTEEDKAEIKAYVDEAILGGEW